MQIAATRSGMRRACFLFFFLAVFTTGTTPSAKAGLQAPVYPGAVPANHELHEQGRVYERVFYTRDSIEQVLAFYRSRLGEMEEIQTGQAYRHVVREIGTRFKAQRSPSWAGIHISSPNPGKEAPGAKSIVSDGRSGPSPLDGADPKCLHKKVFSPLLNMVQLLPNRDWEQFNSICHQYYHLTWSMFFPTDERDGRGRIMTQEQLLMARYRPSGLQAPDSLAKVDPEEIALRMQALAMAGRIDEARALAEQLAAAHSFDVGGTKLRIEDGEYADDWNDWVKLLDEMDGHAHRTMIRIHTNPETWPEAGENDHSAGHGKG